MLLAAGAVLLIFFIFSILPSNPERALLGQRQDAESKRIIRHDFALDQPFYFRFLIYLNDLSPVSIYNRKSKESPIYLDRAKYRDAYKLFYFGENKTIVVKAPYLRRSYASRASVYDMIYPAFKSSAVLLLTAISIALFFGITLGILAALYHRSWPDRFISGFALLGNSLPVFFLAIVIGWLFGYVLQNYTGLNMNGSLYSIDPFEGQFINWKNLILPASVLAIQPMSYFITESRSLFIDVMGRKFILTAKAKGARRSGIAIQHAWLNSTAPLLLLTERWLGTVLAGTLFTEFIFDWKGVGKLTVNAILDADLPVLMGVALLISFIFILTKCISGLIYSSIDPRVTMNLNT